MMSATNVRLRVKVKTLGEDVGCTPLTFTVPAQAGWVVKTAAVTPGKKLWNNCCPFTASPHTKINLAAETFTSPQNIARY
ncbi:hypothetical protein [Komarekiella delphini-convector]|uniref:hypothetical protein n=1 Tax=Komarekiella delphini-convector TaxID=3050158 RepID=UPI001CD84F22|nr:hypothetical protein [Komarekiella delphini-convector]